MCRGRNRHHLRDDLLTVSQNFGHFIHFLAVPRKKSLNKNWQKVFTRAHPSVQSS